MRRFVGFIAVKNNRNPSTRRTVGLANSFRQFDSGGRAPAIEARRISVLLLVGPLLHSAFQQFSFV